MTKVVDICDRCMSDWCWRKRQSNLVWSINCIDYNQPRSFQWYFTKIISKSYESYENVIYALNLTYNEPIIFQCFRFFPRFWMTFYVKLFKSANIFFLKHFDSIDRSLFRCVGVVRSFINAWHMTFFRGLMC